MQSSRDYVHVCALDVVLTMLETKLSTKNFQFLKIISWKKLKSVTHFIKAFLYYWSYLSYQSIYELKFLPPNFNCDVMSGSLNTSSKPSSKTSSNTLNLKKNQSHILFKYSWPIYLKHYLDNLLIKWNVPHKKDVKGWITVSLIIIVIKT